MKIVVIDYDIGNVRSILNAFDKIGITASLTKDPEEILYADGVVLPGVGAFAHGMSNLEKYNLIDVIYKYTDTNKPFLGICLGMQMLLEESQEFKNTKGLALIEGKVIKLPVQDPNYQKLPHVSWNEINEKKIAWNTTILKGIKNKSDMYFVHTYVAKPKNEEEILSSTVYSAYEFCSSIKKNNIYGCQFHPEKSGKIGLNIIRNFVNICREIKNG